MQGYQKEAQTNGVLFLESTPLPVLTPHCRICWQGNPTFVVGILFLNNEIREACAIIIGFESGQYKLLRVM